MRVRTDFFVGALTRRAEAAGAYAAVARRGAGGAGALFVCVRRRSGSFDLYGPAPQSVAGSDDRLFSRLLEDATEAQVAVRVASETRFDPDLWLVDIDDGQARPFVELVREP